MLSTLIEQENERKRDKHYNTFLFHQEKKWENKKRGGDTKTRITRLKPKQHDTYIQERKRERK